MGQFLKIIWTPKYNLPRKRSNDRNVV